MIDPKWWSLLNILGFILLVLSIIFAALSGNTTDGFLIFCKISTFLLAIGLTLSPVRYLQTNDNEVLDAYSFSILILYVLINVGVGMMFCIHIQNLEINYDLYFIIMSSLSLAAFCLAIVFGVLGGILWVLFKILSWWYKNVCLQLCDDFCTNTESHQRTPKTTIKESALELENIYETIDEIV